MKYHDWYGCYSNGWTQQDIVPAAFAHPAKFAKGLIKRIYDHLLTEGHIKPGDKIVDPFGGVGLGSLYAMRNGLHWHGVELEEKFVDLGNENLALWSGRFAAHFPNWGTARLVQGDSRQLASVLEAAGCVVSSPPFAESLASVSSSFSKWQDEQIDLGLMKGNKRGKNATPQTDYGFTPGQLGSMKEGDIEAVISSPPYSDAVAGVGEGPGARFDPVFHNGENSTKKSSANGYGRTEGNLGSMPVGAVVGSPPYSESLQNHGVGRACQLEGSNNGMGDYGQTPGNIGNDSSDTFWQAAAVIVAQCYEVLGPGGVAAWVCGDYVRDGQRVKFGRQWLQLCESVGFTGVECVRAWKTEPGPVQTGIFEDKDLTVDRVSFFRRLANNRAIANGNGSAVVLNEDVIIVRRL